MSRVRAPSIAHLLILISGVNKYSVSILEAIILGIIQGLTEFLPISSSGHLMLAQYLFGFDHLEHFVFFNLVCHLGTLLAICWIFFDKISQTIQSQHRFFFQLCIATLPLAPLVFFMKSIKTIFDKPQFLGFFFLTTASLLYLGIRFGKNTSSSISKHSWRDCFLIGCFQAIAVLPGISRSGATISGARLLGWTSQDAVTFSFLLAIPPILGGTLHELLHLPHASLATPLPIGLFQYLSGFATSFLVGIFSLHLIQRLAVKQQFMYFVWYCLGLGIFTLIYFYYV